MSFSHCINTPRKTSANTASFLKLPQSTHFPFLLYLTLKISKKFYHKCKLLKRGGGYPTQFFHLIGFETFVWKLRKESNQRSLESYFQQNWSFSKLKIIKKILFNQKLRYKLVWTVLMDISEKIAVLNIFPFMYFRSNWICGIGLTNRLAPWESWEH